MQNIFFRPTRIEVSRSATDRQAWKMNIVILVCQVQIYRLQLPKRWVCHSSNNPHSISSYGNISNSNSCAVFKTVSMSFMSLMQANKNDHPAAPSLLKPPPPSIEYIYIYFFFKKAYKVPKRWLFPLIEILGGEGGKGCCCSGWTYSSTYIYHFEKVIVY